MKAWKTAAFAALVSSLLVAPAYAVSGRAPVRAPAHGSPSHLAQAAAKHMAGTKASKSPAVKRSPRSRVSDLELPQLG
jgi:hypothetical protein